MSQDPASPRPASTRTASRLTSLPVRVAVLCGLGLLVWAVASLKSAPDPASVHSDLPELQLNRALNAQQPALVFFHSLSCESCLAMTETVAQVFPDYETSIALVDVDVYEDRSLSLVQRERIQVIPTLVFYDPAGARQVVIGEISADELRQTLEALIGRPAS